MLDFHFVSDAAFFVHIDGAGILNRIDIAMLTNHDVFTANELRFRILKIDLITFD